jgi:hypothetical protein
LEDVAAVWRIILRLILSKKKKDVDWYEMAQDTVQWLVLVNTVMKFHVPHNVGEICSQLSDYQLLKRYSSPWS